MLMPVYAIRIERSFCAAHSLRLRGEVEPVHGHNWIVRVEIEGPALDDDGLLCDFHAVEAMLDAIIAPFRNRNLNAVEPFDRVNPSAELLARHIGDAMRERLPASVRVACVGVREAPACWAIYRPES